MDFAGFDDLYHLGNVLAQADCLKLCKEEHPYGDVTTDLPEKVITGSDFGSACNVMF